MTVHATVTELAGCDKEICLPSPLQKKISDLSLEQCVSAKELLCFELKLNFNGQSFEPLK